MYGKYFLSRRAGSGELQKIETRYAADVLLGGVGDGDHELYVWNWCEDRAGKTNEKIMVAFYPLFQDIISGRYDFKRSQKYRIVFH